MAVALGAVVPLVADLEEAEEAVGNKDDPGYNARLINE